MSRSLCGDCKKEYAPVQTGIELYDEFAKGICNICAASGFREVILDGTCPTLIQAVATALQEEFTALPVERINELGINTRRYHPINVYNDITGMGFNLKDKLLVITKCATVGDLIACCMFRFNKINVEIADLIVVGVGNVSLYALGLDTPLASLSVCIAQLEFIKCDGGEKRLSLLRAYCKEHARYKSLLHRLPLLKEKQGIRKLKLDLTLAREYRPSSEYIIRTYPLAETDGGMAETFTCTVVNHFKNEEYEYNLLCNDKFTQTLTRLYATDHALTKEGVKDNHIINGTLDTLCIMAQISNDGRPQVKILLKPIATTTAVWHHPVICCKLLFNTLQPLLFLIMFFIIVF